MSIWVRSESERLEKLDSDHTGALDDDVCKEKAYISANSLHVEKNAALEQEAGQLLKLRRDVSKQSNLKILQVSKHIDSTFYKLRGFLKYFIHALKNFHCNIFETLMALEMRTITVSTPLQNRKQEKHVYYSKDAEKLIRRQLVLTMRKKLFFGHTSTDRNVVCFYWDNLYYTIYKPNMHRKLTVL